MKYTMERMVQAMIEYNTGDPKRVHHALKVLAFARAIGRSESLSGRQMEILEIAAVFHDIGIHNSEIKYGSSSGKYQELEGPPVAKSLLSAMEVEQNVVDRVCYLIGHHHTYTQIDGMDYQILIEADFLVNLYEDEMGQRQAKTVLEKYFKTQTGKKFLTEMYLTPKSPVDKENPA